MLVTLGTSRYTLSDEVASSWDEVLEYIAIQKVKRNEIKTKIIKSIISHREVVCRMLELSNDDLQTELKKLDEVMVDIDRYGMNGHKFPFVVKQRIANKA